MPDALKDVKKQLDPEYYPADENHWEVKGRSFDDDKNIRVIVNLNLNASAPYADILDIKGAPPLLVVVVRADTKITALGVLEEAKNSNQKAHSKPSVASKLTEGVGSLARRLTQ